MQDHLLETRILSLGIPDLEAMAQTHVAAFPGALLTGFGGKALISNYRAHLENRGLIRAARIESSGRLVGLCIAVCDETPRRFMRLRLSFLVGQAIRRPALWCSGRLWLRIVYRLRELVVTVFGLRAIDGGGHLSGFRILVLAVHPDYQGTWVRQHARSRCQTHNPGR